MKKILLVVLMFLLCACGAQGNILSVSGNIVSFDNNGNGDIDISNSDFLSAGFDYGDSVNIEFGNGDVIEDVPFLSGMYVEYGEIMVYGKESKDKVSFIQKYKNFEENYDVDENASYTITMNEEAKYSYIEEVGKLTYSNNFEDYNDEVKFANFREVKVGDIKEGRLYRSTSVINNSANRRDYSAKLALDYNVKTILNVIDKDDEFEELIANLDGDCKTLIENTKIVRAPISNDYQSDKNNKIIAEGLIELINCDCPYLVHCLEGKDRTGYVMAIIESLCNASYQEIVDDYMTTYDNYYGVNKDTDLEKYNYIKETNIDAMLKFITKSDDLENVDLVISTKSFLMGYGMSEENINQLINRLCN